MLVFFSVCIDVLCVGGGVHVLLCLCVSTRVSKSFMCMTNAARLKAFEIGVK